MLINQCPAKGVKDSKRFYVHNLICLKEESKAGKKKSSEWPGLISLEKQGRKALTGYQPPQTWRSQHFQEWKQTAPGDSQVTESAHGGGDLLKIAVTMMQKLSDRWAKLLKEEQTSSPRKKACPGQVPGLDTPWARRVSICQRHWADGIPPRATCATRNAAKATSLQTCYEIRFLRAGHFQKSQRESSRQLKLLQLKYL